MKRQERDKILADLTVAFEFARKKLAVKLNPMMDVERGVSEAALKEPEAEALG